MQIKEYFPTILSVLTDFRVIGTIVVVFLIVTFASYVVNYKKKPAVKKGKKKMPATAAKTESTEIKASTETTSDTTK
ncbi:MAG: hypothetical protein GX677_09015 [Treponema sp.]|jgi:hypothetical protein|nr:hypothetical protein [Treponema sp.]